MLAVYLDPLDAEARAFRPPPPPFTPVSASAPASHLRSRLRLRPSFRTSIPPQPPLPPSHARAAPRHAPRPGARDAAQRRRAPRRRRPAVRRQPPLSQGRSAAAATVGGSGRRRAAPRRRDRGGGGRRGRGTSPALFFVVEAASVGLAQGATERFERAARRPGLVRVQGAPRSGSGEVRGRSHRDDGERVRGRACHLPVRLANAWTQESRSGVRVVALVLAL